MSTSMNDGRIVSTALVSVLCAYRRERLKVVFCGDSESKGSPSPAFIAVPVLRYET